jgi:hypothetical protein
VPDDVLNKVGFMLPNNASGCVGIYLTRDREGVALGNMRTTPVKVQDKSIGDQNRHLLSCKIIKSFLVIVSCC